MPPRYCLQSCQPPTAKEVVNHPGSFTSFSGQWTAASQCLPCWSPRGRSHWSTGHQHLQPAALPVPEPAPLSELPLLLSLCGWTPSSSVPTTSFQSSCPKERKEKQDPDARAWRTTSGHGVSNPFHYCSPPQTMTSSFSFTNIDLACITPAGKTTLPFIIFLGTGK